VLYGTICPDNSHRRFVQALYYSPDMLDSKWFSDLDSTVADSIVNDAQVMLSENLVHRKNDHLLKARLAKLLLHQGKTDAAEKLLHEVTRSLPNLNRPWLMLGDIAAAQNDTVAIQYYERAIQLDPSDAWAKIRIGDWHLDRDDLSRAFGYYIDALRTAYLFPTEHSFRSFLMYNTLTVPNDVVPPAFYGYIRPYVNVRKLAEVIVRGYEQEGNADKAALYRQLSNGEVGVREVVHWR